MLNEELTNKLHNKFPNLYKLKRGFEHADGWYDIIYNLSEQLEAMILEESNPEDIYARQVKEKYGTLRFYMSQSTDNMESVINDAEKQTEKTCEVCGKEGRRTTVNQGWVQTRCDSHETKFNFK